MLQVCWATLCIRTRNNQFVISARSDYQPDQSQSRKTSRWRLSDCAPCWATRHPVPVNPPSDLLEIASFNHIEPCLLSLSVAVLHSHPACAPAWSSFLGVFFFPREKKQEQKKGKASSFWTHSRIKKRRRPWPGFTSSPALGSVCVRQASKRCPWCWKAPRDWSEQRHLV